jgi:preprotein translocase subunit SecG
MTFWVIPYKLIAAIIIILVALFFALRFGLRNYNKRIIAKANGTHHKSKPKSKK